MHWVNIALDAEILRHSSWLGLVLTATLGCCKCVSIISFSATLRLWGAVMEELGKSCTVYTLSQAWDKGAVGDFVCLCHSICAFAPTLN